MFKARPIYCPNVILLHAEHNNAFSISEAKAIIKNIAKVNKLITVYINHKIDDADEKQLVIKNADYSIYKETRKLSKNIASEFLKSGSNYVYYIKASKENYRLAFVHIYDILSNEYPIICMANYLAKELQAGAIVVNSNTNKQELISDIYNSEVLFDTNELLAKQIGFTEHKVVW